LLQLPDCLDCGNPKVDMATPARILIVDDDPDLCDACTAVLRDEGYDVRVEGSAADGLRAMREQRPDLLILDVMMEQADSGFRLAEAVAREYHGLPVLLLSSLVDGGVVDFHRLPVDEVAGKPLRSAELRKSVRRLLDKARAGTGKGTQ
jgi:DNA-binding response OmpR family regulator